MILIEMSDLYGFCYWIPRFTKFYKLMWKSWLLVTILSGCIAVTRMSSSSRAVDTPQQMHKLFRQTWKKHRVQVWEWIQFMIFELSNRICRDNLLLKILLLCCMVWWDTEFHIMQMRQDIFILSLWQDNKTDINITCKALLHNKCAEKVFTIFQSYKSYIGFSVTALWNNQKHLLSETPR